MTSSKWFKFAIATFFMWGFWAFFSKLNTDMNNPVNGFILETAGITIMGIFLLIAMNFRIGYHKRGSFFALLSGIASSGGMLLFLFALKTGSSVIIVPMAALYPGITVVLSRMFLKEKITGRQTLGILLAVIASVLMAF